MKTMKIETIELSVPQRRLMEIFAKDLNEGDFGDKRIRLLLEYLRELLADEKMPSDTLCRMLDGTLLDLDFYKFYTAHMCNIYDCDYDSYAPTPDELSAEDYLDSLKNCFPQVFTGLLEKPRQFISASENLILTWEMGYGNRICDEIYTASEETRQIAYIIYDYIDTRSNAWPFMMDNFLAQWTNYLLTREWSDKEAFYKQKWHSEKALRESYQQVNEHLVKENLELKEAIQERFITIMDAARAVMAKLYHKDDVEVPADNLRKLITRHNSNLVADFTGKQNRSYFAVEKLIPLFKAEDIALTDGEITDAIINKARTREELES